MISSLQEAAVQQRSKGGNDAIPAVVWTTLFCGKQCSNRGDMIAVHGTQIAYIRKPTCTEWLVNSLLRAFVQDSSTMPIAALRVSFKNSGSQTTELKTSHQGLYDRLFEASNGPYKGHSPTAFHQKMQQSARLRESPSANPALYGQVIAIVQSHGAGKSRLLQEPSASLVPSARRTGRQGKLTRSSQNWGSPRLSLDWFKEHLWKENSAQPRSR